MSSVTVHSGVRKLLPKCRAPAIPTNGMSIFADHVLSLSLGATKKDCWARYDRQMSSGQWLVLRAMLGRSCLRNGSYA